MAKCSDYLGVRSSGGIVEAESIPSPGSGDVSLTRLIATGAAAVGILVFRSDPRPDLGPHRPAPLPLLWPALGGISDEMHEERCSGAGRVREVPCRGGCGWKSWLGVD